MKLILAAGYSKNAIPPLPDLRHPPLVDATLPGPRKSREPDYQGQRGAGKACRRAVCPEEEICSMERKTARASRQTEKAEDTEKTQTSEAEEPKEMTMYGCSMERRAIP